MENNRRRGIVKTMTEQAMTKQPRLGNAKHEAIARKLAKGRDLRSAYQDIYGCGDKGASRVYQLIKKYPEIADRQQTLLDLAGMSKTACNSKLKTIFDNPKRQVIDKNGDIIDLHDNNLLLETTKTVLKMHGAIDNKAPLIDNRQVNITNTTSNINVDGDILEETLSKLAVFNKDMFSTQDGEIETIEYNGAAPEGIIEGMSDGEVVGNSEQTGGVIDDSNENRKS